MQCAKGPQNQVRGKSSTTQPSSARRMCRMTVLRLARIGFQSCGKRCSFLLKTCEKRSVTMTVARHPRPTELVGVPIEEIMETYVGRFRDRKPDWAAFEDAKIEGYKRAQHRFIGAGGSGKHGDPTIIPAKNFTLSIMFVPPGQGNAPHTHEVE